MKHRINSHRSGSSLSCMVWVFAFVCVYQAAILAVMAWQGWCQA